MALAVCNVDEEEHGEEEGSGSGEDTESEDGEDVDSDSNSAYYSHRIILRDPSDLKIRINEKFGTATERMSRGLTAINEDTCGRFNEVKEEISKVKKEIEKIKKEVVETKTVLGLVRQKVRELRREMIDRLDTLIVVVCSQLLNP